MKLLLLHLSDIHIKSSDDFLLKRADQIAASVSNLDTDIGGCVVVITGDIAFSGQANEYALAEQFLTQLHACLTQTIGLSNIPVVLVPGNHDCDFSTPNQVRDILLGQVTKGSVSTVSDDLMAQCVAVQSQYWQFTSRVKNSAIPVAPRDMLCPVEEIQIGDKRIAIQPYNTAWMSQINELQGSLIFPQNSIPEEDADADLVVALFHHPYNWLESMNSRVFRTKIERMADLILTGHEHEVGQYFKSNRLSGDTNEYIEGGVLQDGKTQESAFNAVLIDFNTDKQKFWRCRWNGQLYATEAIQSTWQDFQRNKNRTRNRFVICESWTKYLTSPGAGFTNSRKENLELSDIFVEPNVRELTRIDTLNQVVQPPISGEQFWHRLIDSNHVAILGSESSGKTTLAKNLYTKFHESGFVPLFLSGEEIKGCDRDRLMNLLEKLVEQQYSANLSDHFRQMEQGKRVLMLDNYHLIELNNKGSQELFKHLKAYFGRIVLFTHDLSKVQELGVEPGEQNPLSSFIQFEIQEFGNQLREELIERWFTIGQEFSIAATDLENQVIETKRIVDAALGRNLLPPYPIFILIVLQQIEAQTNLMTGGGALGYLYEHLITTSLAKTAKRLDLDTAHAFLSEVAHQMFELGTRRLNDAQMTEVHRRYCQEYKMNVKFESIEKALVEADLLTTSEGIYAFKYKYCYYYFAARHLRDRLSSHEGKAQLRRLAEHVYKEEFANILVFLTYLSKEHIVIDEMLRAARTVYPGVDPCNFSEEMKFVSTLQDHPQRIVLIDKDAKTARKEMNQVIDRVESQVKRPDEDADLNDALRINVAFKTIQILGQILKNHPGSIKGGQKLEVAEECYFLGLRALRALFNVLEPNTADIVSLIADQLERFESNPEERRRKAKKFLSLLIEGIALAFIKKISGSVGTEALRQTFEELVAKHDELSVHLIDLSVKLDHFQRFPDTEFDNLIEEAISSKNTFTTLMLRHLAFDHFYRYTIPRHVKQRYCEKLGIELKTVTMLEYRRATS